MSKTNSVRPLQENFLCYFSYLIFHKWKTTAEESIGETRDQRLCELGPVLHLLLQNDKGKHKDSMKEKKKEIKK